MACSSVAQQEELAKQIDDYLTNLPGAVQERGTRASDAGDSMWKDDFESQSDPAFWDTSNDTEDTYIHQEDDFNQELQDLEEEWGDWSQDGFIWSPDAEGEITKYSGNSAGRDVYLQMGEFANDSFDIDEEESLEDFEARIRKEWRGHVESEDVDVQVAMEDRVE